MGFFLPMAIMAGVQTIANISGRIHAAKVARRNTNLTIAENKRLAELAYQREQQGITEMNKYNQPVNQMKRFEQAGLNPNLVYTQGTPGNQSVFPKYNAPSVEYKYQPKFSAEDITPLTSLYVDAQKVKLLIAQGSKAQAEAKIEKSMAKYADELARQKMQTGFNEARSSMLKRIFQEEEFNRFFQLNEKDGKYYLKPGQEDLFTQNLVGRWLKPFQDLETAGASEARIRAQELYLKQQLEMLSGVYPWLTPLVNFFRLIF